jgi:cysteine desulfurase
VNKYGEVDPDEIRGLMTDKTILVSIMHANNEVGTIEPIEEVGKLAKERGVYFHVDAVQTAGHVVIDVGDLNVNLMSLAAHKMGGPKGVGALYVRKGTRFTPLLHGGHQEKRRRASTENVPGIVGFGWVAERAKGETEKEARRLVGLRRRLEEGIKAEIPDIKFNGHPDRRLPGLVNFSVSFVEGESIVLALDGVGVACSTGSACTAADLKASHVLLAMGLSHELAHGSLRMSMGRETRAEDIDYVLGVLPGIVEKLRLMSPLKVEDRARAF